MALAHLASALFAAPDPPPAIHAFIVDHRARPGSTADANAVVAFLSARYGFAVHVLPLDPPHPSLPSLHLYPRSAFETAVRQYRQYRWHALSRHCLLSRICCSRTTSTPGRDGGYAHGQRHGVRQHGRNEGDCEAARVTRCAGRGGVPEHPAAVFGPRWFGRGWGRGWGWENRDWKESGRTQQTQTPPSRGGIRYLLGGGSFPPAAAAATTSTDSRHLPKALSCLSLVNFAWQIHSRVFLEDEHITARLHSLGRAHLSICTFSDTARLSLLCWPPQDMAADLPALSRALQKLVDLLTLMQRPDARPLCNQAAPAATVLLPQTMAARVPPACGAHPAEHPFPQAGGAGRSEDVVRRARPRCAAALALRPPPVPAAQADTLLSNAIKKVPGYARFTVPVAAAAVDSPSAPAGQVVGFLTLGLWKRGVFAEASPATATTTAAAPPPPDHAAADTVPPPPDPATVGAVECVMRGWGEYMGEDIPSTGLGRGWDVEWVNLRAEYGPRRKRRTEWAKTFAEGEGDTEGREGEAERERAGEGDAERGKGKMGRGEMLVD
ncbi:hypothetical protein EV426DRAFT_577903 [Tirmania nivea]|nr:hypothetical protein EV426DRAFT_577903 [Tirmania nivea]